MWSLFPGARFGLPSVNRPLPGAVDFGSKTCRSIVGTRDDNDGARDRPDQFEAEAAQIVTASSP